LAASAWLVQALAAIKIMVFYPENDPVDAGAFRPTNAALTLLELYAR
jgi:hypothetical protein